MRNEELGSRIGVSPSMASRLRSGDRLPSTKVLNAIHKELGIPLQELVTAHGLGPRAFGELLRSHLADDAAPQAA